MDSVGTWSFLPPEGLCLFFLFSVISGLVGSFDAVHRLSSVEKF
uniref:Uncharacterized protein n=1 Tax=Rhizophora mucronata TaxID=61149 RepID=A0A2P2PD05_RHIMU